MRSAAIQLIVDAMKHHAAVASVQEEACSALLFMCNIGTPSWHTCTWENLQCRVKSDGIDALQWFAANRQCTQTTSKTTMCSRERLHAVAHSGPTWFVSC